MGVEIGRNCSVCSVPYQVSFFEVHDGLVTFICDQPECGNVEILPIGSTK